MSFIGTDVISVDYSDYEESIIINNITYRMSGDRILVDPILRLSAKTEKI